jgi:hypothetical protein
MKRLLCKSRRCQKIIDTCGHQVGFGVCIAIASIMQSTKRGMTPCIVIEKFVIISNDIAVNANNSCTILSGNYAISEFYALDRSYRLAA